MGQLFGLETELKGKELVIRDLQEEIAAMAKKLAQAAVRNEVELTQKLLTFNRELGAQAEEIKALREQVLEAFIGSKQGKHLSGTGNIQVTPRVVCVSEIMGNRGAPFPVPLFPFLLFPFPLSSLMPLASGFQQEHPEHI